MLERTQSHWKSKLKVAIDPSRAAQVAAINGVRWVAPVPVFELFKTHPGRLCRLPR